MGRCRRRVLGVGSSGKEYDFSEGPCAISDGSGEKQPSEHHSINVTTTSETMVDFIRIYAFTLRNGFLEHLRNKLLTCETKPILSHPQHRK